MSNHLTNHSEMVSNACQPESSILTLGNISGQGCAEHCRHLNGIQHQALSGTFYLSNTSIHVLQLLQNQIVTRQHKQLIVN